jgi:hypothetical protein
MSMNPNLTLDFVLANLDKNWKWHSISNHPKVTVKFVEQHPEVPWDYNALSLNANMTAAFIERNSDKQWNWYYLSFNEFEHSPKAKMRLQEERFEKAVTKLQERFLHRYYRPTSKLFKERKLRQFFEIFGKYT